MAPTFLLTTARLAPTGGLPTNLSDFQHVPVSCEEQELAQAIKQVELGAAPGTKVIGLVNRDMVNQMVRIMDDFEREL